MRPAVFLDRDGAIIVDKNYLSDPEGVELLPNAIEGLLQFQSAGFLLIIITNQSGVGRGMFTAKDAEAVNERLVQVLSRNGITITDTYYCPHAPDDHCQCRKPLPGMILEAAAKHGIDLSRSITIGDKESDVKAGQAAGCRLSILISPNNIKTDTVAVPNLEAAATLALEAQ